MLISRYGKLSTESIHLYEFVSNTLCKQIRRISQTNKKSQICEIKMLTTFWLKNCVIFGILFKFIFLCHRKCAHNIQSNCEASFTSLASFNRDTEGVCCKNLYSSITFKRINIKHIVHFSFHSLFVRNLSQIHNVQTQRYCSQLHGIP